MNTDRAQTVVVGAMLTAVTVSTIHDLSQNRSKRAPALRVPVGGMVATLILLGVSEASPDIAAMFAVLVLTATLLGPAGSTTFNAINRLVK